MEPVQIVGGSFEPIIEAGAKKCPRKQVRSRSTGRCRSAKAARKSQAKAAKRRSNKKPHRASAASLKKRSGSKIRKSRRVVLSRRRPTSGACSAVKVPQGASPAQRLAVGARCVSKGCTFAKGVCRKRTPKADLMKRRNAMLRASRESGMLPVTAARLFEGGAVEGGNWGMYGSRRY